MRRATLWMLLTASATLAVDQGTKALARAWPIGASRAWIPGFVETVHAENPGAVLGLLGGWPAVARLSLFGLVGLGLLVVVLLWIRRLPPRAVALPSALGLVLGGALGNTLDRLVYGAVVDWLVLGAGWIDPALAALGIGLETPAFNVADVALGVGLIGVLVAIAAEALAPEREPPTG